MQRAWQSTQHKVSMLQMVVVTFAVTFTHLYGGLHSEYLSKSQQLRVTRTGLAVAVKPQWEAQARGRPQGSSKTCRSRTPYPCGHIQLHQARGSAQEGPACVKNGLAAADGVQPRGAGLHQGGLINVHGSKNMPCLLCVHSGSLGTEAQAQESPALSLAVPVGGDGVAGELGRWGAV